MKAIVTGGAGFIGSHLVQELVRKKYQVVVIDNLSNGDLKNIKFVKKNIKFVKSDISKNKKLSEHFKNVDYVFHLAGLVDVSSSIKNPLKYYNNNVNGTLNILKALRSNKIKKFIYAASASCYGNCKKLPTSENSKIEILSPYALTKWLGELMVLNWSKKFNLPVASLRFFNVYGPRSKKSGSYSAVINVFIKQKLSKKPLTVVGDGKQTRSFVYVTDVVGAMIKAARSISKGEVFNVGAKKSIAINDLSKLIGGKKIHIAKRPGELKHSKANINKIEKKLNWKPRINLNFGLKKIIKEF